jgi:hypothetical protein
MPRATSRGSFKRWAREGSSGNPVVAFEPDAVVIPDPCFCIQFVICPGDYHGPLKST